MTKKRGLLLLLFLLVVSFVIYESYISQRHFRKHRQSPQVATQPTHTPSMQVTSVPINNQQTNTYVSHALGITFIYPKTVSVYTINPYEIGSKIYIGIGGKDPAEDQYMQVFHTTGPVSSLDAAITQQLLQGISPSDCFVVDGGFNQHYASHFTTAIISYPGFNGSDIPNPNAKKCPASYAATSGENYFLMDNNHTDTFLFLSIGQQPLAGTDTIEPTIKILY